MAIDSQHEIQAGRLSRDTGQLGPDLWSHFIGQITSSWRCSHLLG
jgi:hypothetical protein